MEAGAAMLHELTPMRLSAVQLGTEPRRACVVLDGADLSTAVMMIALPLPDAMALVQALTQTDRDCSETCAAVLAPVRRLEAAVVRTVIDHGPDGFCARLSLNGHAIPYTLTCDVADALALAVRARAPIYATGRALGAGASHGDGAGGRSTTACDGTQELL